MTSDSESGTGRPGLLASLGRLFRGGRKDGPPEGTVEDERPGDAEVASGVAAAGGAAAERPGDVPEPPEPREEDGEEGELVLGPSLKASPTTPEPEPEAEPSDADDGLVLGSGSAGERGETLDVDKPTPADDAEPDEETILARLRAVREEQGEAVEEQQAAPSEDSWAAAFTSDDTEPAQGEDAGTGLSWLSGDQHDDGEGETIAEQGPDVWKLAEDADTGPDDERRSADEGPPGEETAPDAPAGAVPLFPGRATDDAADEPDPWSTEEDGAEPVAGADDNQEAGFWTPEVTEPEPRGDEPAESEDHEVPTAEPQEGVEAEAAGADERPVGSAEDEAPAPESAEPQGAEADESASEAEEAGAEPIEGAPPVAGETEARTPETPEAEVAEAEEPEEAASAAADPPPGTGEDEPAPPGAEVVAPGAAGTPSEAGESPAEDAPDEAPGAAGLDEAQVEEIVRRLIREELEGELGARLSANIRRVVREEVSHALLRNR